MTSMTDFDSLLFLACNPD